MFGKNKNTDDGVEIQDEEFEFYDMADFEKRVFKKLQILEMKIDGLSGETNENQQRIKNIQFQFTRQTLFWYAKWLIILGFGFYVYSHYISPFVSQAQDKYEQIEAPLNAFNKAQESGWWDKFKMLFPEEETATSTEETSN